MRAVRGAEYFFQAEIIEINAGAANASTGVSIAGLQLGGAMNRDEIGLDVSIIDAATGDIVNAVNVRRKLGGSATSVSGVNALVSTVMADKGTTASVYTPDITHTSTRKSSLDAALRECLEEATACSLCAWNRPRLSDRAPRARSRPRH